MEEVEVKKTHYKVIYSFIIDIPFDYQVLYQFVPICTKSITCWGLLSEIVDISKNVNLIKYNVLQIKVFYEFVSKSNV